MSKNENGDTFKQLVSEISENERQSLLNKMAVNNDPEDIVHNTCADFGEFDLSERFKTESLFYRLIMYIKSFFLQTSVQTVYQKNITSVIAHQIEKDFPGIINYKKRILCVDFYNKLQELQKSASFFKPYLKEMQNNPGHFYALLALSDMPTFSEELDTINPYKMEEKPTPSSDNKLSLIRKMDLAFGSIPETERSLMYQSVIETDWLCKLTDLKLTKFVALFSDIITDDYSCSFFDISKDFSKFADVLSVFYGMTDSALRALYLNAAQAKEFNLYNAEEEDSDLKDFISKGRTYLGMIRMFATSVPVKQLACVIYQNPQWQNTKLGGYENWFATYKNYCKSEFEKNWKDWENNCQKEFLRKRLKSQFAINDFPLLPVRVWKSFSERYFFKSELTAGFIYWFFTEKYRDCYLILNKILVEGIFLNKDNRSELSSVIDGFSEIEMQIKEFADSFTDHGAIGSVFQKMTQKGIRSLESVAKIGTILKSAETEIHTLKNDYCKNAIIVNNILAGILEISVNPKYDKLSNLKQIGGRGKDFFEFQNSIEVMHILFRDAIQLLDSLEEINK